ncbi:MAG: bifunctional phosphopantothenoylcysteine decarboxylase/phosphopantothenate--cysteine ligase CoaBC [Betaproteobacteria bacterium]|nr:bifunctional phosphopantothenoylcysteine decarboxylase/phosphopantothenate--cysteine ligase CoaBC [Betaproteobacteria bacterium]
MAESIVEMRQKRIVLGITGGIAAYKAADLVRLLIKDGIEVQVVMTEAACGFITPVTMQALSGKPVFTDMWDARIADNMAHIELSRGADAIVVVPATTDFLAKLANGLADDLLSTLCVARECPLLVAPAMNRQMWENKATQRNVAQLARDGVVLLGPASGDQACGEVGMGRMLEAQQIFEAVTAFLQPKFLTGTHVLITAGPTFEAIDPVRGITNRSSGKMGYAIARAALDAGAKVTLVTGPVSLEAPAAARVERVESAGDMFEAVKKHAKAADIFIGVAAVADYRVAKTSKQKIKKTGADLDLKLVPNPDILAWVAALPKPPFCVGFAAESQKLHEFADAKRRRKKVPLMVANLAQDAIGADDNEVTLLDDIGTHTLPRASKPEIARQLVAHIAKRYKSRKNKSR